MFKTEIIISILIIKVHVNIIKPSLAKSMNKSLEIKNRLLGTADPGCRRERESGLTPKHSVPTNL